MSEVTVIVRIVLYIAAGWLAGKGVPPELAHFISSDPDVLGLVSELLGGVMVLLSLLWWRLAKRFGWST